MVWFDENDRFRNHMHMGSHWVKNCRMSGVAGMILQTTQVRIGNVDGNRNLSWFSPIAYLFCSRPAVFEIPFKIRDMDWCRTPTYPGPRRHGFRYVDLIWNWITSRIERYLPCDPAIYWRISTTISICATISIDLAYSFIELGYTKKKRNKNDWLWYRRLPESQWSG